MRILVLPLVASLLTLGACSSPAALPPLNDCDGINKSVALKAKPAGWDPYNVDEVCFWEGKTVETDYGAKGKTAISFKLARDLPPNPDKILKNLKPDEEELDDYPVNYQYKAEAVETSKWTYGIVSAGSYSGARDEIKTSATYYYVGDTVSATCDYTLPGKLYESDSTSLDSPQVSPLMSEEEIQEVVAQFRKDLARELSLHYDYIKAHEAEAQGACNDVLDAALKLG